ncbi:hypothetical protein K488DRAFT_81832 [Vararia minispora EC-137]|uniref:Uncharacterized protein n=1 Tax=Vararia minispora EC-137 TaxID=1314806 RepID=A0ACB8QZQ6_9AGAM|nr:hypothetical protein K488DRAFT_81832 [Vararia minispora EC-137]
MSDGSSTGDGLLTSPLSSFNLGSNSDGGGLSSTTPYNPSHRCWIDFDRWLADTAQRVADTARFSARRMASKASPESLATAAFAQHPLSITPASPPLAASVLT